MFKSPLEEPHKLSNSDHIVQFYESDEYLTSIVTDFAIPVLSSGEGLALIVTQAHRRSFVKSFSEYVEVDKLMSEGQLVIRDAEETLSRIYQHGEIDKSFIFDQVVNELNAMKLKFSKVSAFGEMVNILWRKDIDATMELERVWNEVCLQNDITVLCAYSLNHFMDASMGHSFHSLCSSHTHVIPSEELMCSRGDEQLRLIALWQQRSRALDREMERRQEYERAYKKVLHQLSVNPYPGHSGVQAIF